ncbi:MAG TPA: hypothetical protein VF322_01945 [Gammaproteobacteria bacterium]
MSPRLTGWLAALTLALAACAQPGAEAEREAVTLAAREQAAGGTADAGSAAPGEVAAAGDEGADASPRRKARRRAYPAKPTGPISLDYALAGDVQPGVPVDVRVTIGVEPGLTDIAVEARVSEGLALVSPALARYAEAPQGEPIVWTVTVTPRAEGTHELTLLARADEGGRRQSASLVVPIRTGAAKAERAQGAQGVKSAPGAEAEPRTDERGEPISVLPAEEPD